VTTDTESDGAKEAPNFPESMRMKNVSMRNDGRIAFTDLANNAVGTFDIESGKYRRRQ
jgi:hypothetical protein